MLILGINDSHDASASLIKDGKLLMCIAEERIKRVKMISGYPVGAIKHIFKSLNYKFSDIDHVAVATKKLTGSNLWNGVADYKIQDWYRNDGDSVCWISINYRVVDGMAVYGNSRMLVGIFVHWRKLPFDGK